MLRKKQAIGVLCITVVLSTSLLPTAWWNPFRRIWEAIYDLQGRTGNVEESINRMSDFIDEISRVEFLGKLVVLPRVHKYEYGVSGIWNVSKIQMEGIDEKLSAMLGGFDLVGHDYQLGSPFPNEGYERVVTVGVYNVDAPVRDLTEAEIEAVRLLIEGYLAKP